jgi:hypothetical protein
VAKDRRARLPRKVVGYDKTQDVAVLQLLAIRVAAALYVAGRLHQPDYTFSMFGADPFPPKSLLATIALGLAGVQVLLALWIYRKLPLAGSPPRPVPVTHRVTGFAVFALTIPVAVHCLIVYGVQLTSPRVAIHSVAGCFLYGAFAAKVLLVHSRRLPGWALPVAGGTLAIVIGVLWYTSALCTTTATSSLTCSRTDRPPRPLAAAWAHAPPCSTARTAQADT